MKISRKWLEEYIELKESDEELKKLFTEMGFPVEDEEREGDDVVFELEVTPNRPDCLSHYGVARELSVFLDRELKPFKVDLKEDEPEAEEIARVEIKEPSLCPRYVARVVTGVNVRPSPPWLVEKLRKMGLESINNIVDISNYVLFAFGHPTHVFDLDKLEGKEIIVRKARRGEKLLCLDGVERELVEEDLVIADKERPVAIAGVIGGEETGVTYSTRNVLIESAYFNPITVRRSRRRHGLSTDASYRFERGTDPEFPPLAADLVAYLIQELADGEVKKGRIDVYPLKEERTRIIFTLPSLNERLGVEVDSFLLKTRLEKAGWKWRELSGREVEVIPPSYRRDVSIFEDVVEEAARIYGYDKIPSVLPSFSMPQGLSTPRREKFALLRKVLAGAGYSEAVNYVFVSAGRNSFSEISHPDLKLKNPLSADAPCLRKDVLLTLLDTISLNLRRGAEGARFFEIGKSYWRENGEPREEWRLAIAEAGKVEEKHWSWSGPKEASFYSLKGAVARVVKALYHEVSFKEDASPLFEEGFCMAVMADGNKVGWVGIVREELKQEADIKEVVFGAEILLEKLLNLPVEPFQFKDLPRFPFIRRDIPFLLPEKYRYSEIERALKDANFKWLEKFFLLDEYRGKGIEEGKRSLTLSFIFRSREKTLKKEEVEKVIEEIISFMKGRFEARVRGKEI